MTKNHILMFPIFKIFLRIILFSLNELTSRYFCKVFEYVKYDNMIGTWGTAGIDTEKIMIHIRIRIIRNNSYNLNYTGINSKSIRRSTRIEKIGCTKLLKNILISERNVAM